MSGLNYKKLGSTLNNICNGPTNHRNTTETPKYRYFLAI